MYWDVVEVSARGLCRRWVEDHRDIASGTNWHKYT